MSTLVPTPEISKIRKSISMEQEWTLDAASDILSDIAAKTDDPIVWEEGQHYITLADLSRLIALIAGR